MNILSGVLLIILGIWNLALVRKGMETGTTQFRLGFLRVDKAEQPRKFSVVIVLQAVVSFLLFLMAMYRFNPA